MVAYSGAVKNGTMHGHGTMTYSNGTKYVGTYAKGEREGWGTYTSAKGFKYVGEIRANKYHGRGTYNYANGDKYEGEFRDGVSSGRGKYTYASGRVQEGMWANDKFIGSGEGAGSIGGEGRFRPQAGGGGGGGDFSFGNTGGAATPAAGGFGTAAAGTTAVTTVASGNTQQPAEIRSGAGFMFRLDHTTGTYVCEHREGYTDGWSYTGEVENGTMHGHGTMIGAFGYKYVGRFRFGYPDGHGTCNYASGSKYEGEFRANKPHGWGTWTGSDGSKYEGEHRENQRHGRGTYTFASGQIQVGMWAESKFQGADRSGLGAATAFTPQAGGGGGGGHTGIAMNPATPTVTFGAASSLNLTPGGGTTTPVAGRVGFSFGHTAGAATTPTASGFGTPEAGPATPTGGKLCRLCRHDIGSCKAAKIVYGSKHNGCASNDGFEKHRFRCGHRAGFLVFCCECHKANRKDRGSYAKGFHKPAKSLGAASGAGAVAGAGGFSFGTPVGF